MENETNNTQPEPLPSNGLKTFSTVKVILIFVVIMLAVGFVYAFRSIQSPESTRPLETVAAKQVMQEIKGMSDLITQAEGDPDIVRALNVFRDIAMNEQNTPLDRARALNGINYMYTATDYDAIDVYNVIFSKPPYAQYYTPSGATGADALHPESSGDVAGVEAALVKLNEVSYALTPTHYAISRMEISNVFAYQREQVGVTATERTALQKKYGDKIKALVASYEALPPVTTVEIYPRPQLLQIIFAHSSVLSFIGKTVDKTYLPKGEAGFAQVIALAQSYQQSPGKDDVDVLHSQELLSRIFYASYFWSIYKPTNPNFMYDIVKPLMDESAKTTNVYLKYLPLHKDSKVAPYSVLRDMAKQYPDLKTFLEGRGWKF